MHKDPIKSYTSNRQTVLQSHFFQDISSSEGSDPISPVFGIHRDTECILLQKEIVKSKSIF